MKIADIARAFGMSACQFAEFAGYSKQAMYQGIRKNARSAEVIERLNYMNDELLQAEIETAHRKHEKRKQAVEAFERRLLAGGEDK